MPAPIPSLAIVGGGNMGSALALGLRGRDRAPVLICDSHEPTRERLTSLGFAVAESAAAAGSAEVVLLAVKPQQLAEVAGELAPALPSGRLLISILAGTPLGTLERLFGPRPLIRAMPNTPAAIAQGMTGLCCTSTCSDTQRQFATATFAAVGATEWVAEDQMDALTAISGSGPAYLFRFTEALTAAAAGLGFPPDQAARLALHTVTGSAALLAARQPVEAGTLRAQVTSPGGTTAAALAVFESSGWADIVAAAAVAARDRGRELARLAGA